MKAPLRACLAAGLLAAAVMADEVALMRVLSFAQWYHFGFLVVSCAMLAAAGAGIWRTFKPAAEPLPILPALLASGMFTVQAAVLVLLPLETTRLLADPLQPLIFALVVAGLAAPLLAVGVAITDLLSNPNLPTRLIYGADLAGAALGGALGLVALPVVGSMGVLCLSGAMAAGVVVLLDQTRRQWLGAATALLLLGMSLTAPQLLHPHVTVTKTAGTIPAGQILRDPRFLLFRGEDGVARVDILKSMEGPRILFDAGTAVTRVPQLTADWPSTPPIHDEIGDTFAHAKGGKVLIIGSGGGWEVIRAISHGATRIVAVEISGVVVNYVRNHAPEPIRQLFADPRVELIHDEARSFVERTTEQFDLITLVHTISNTAAASGAMALAEDPLFTTEAIQTLAARLTPGGRLFITRPEAQLGALHDLVRQSVPQATSGPAHFQLWSARRQDRFLATLTWSNVPLQETPPVATAQQLRWLPTDDRPYFHSASTGVELGWKAVREVLEGGGVDQDRARAARLSVEELPAALAMTLVTALVSALILAVMALLTTVRRRQLHPSTWMTAALLGVAFMLVELSAVSRLTVLLGAPSLAFAVVAGALLAGAGAGSALSSHPRLAVLHLPQWACLTASSGALLMAVLVPLAGSALLAAPPWLRTLGALCCVVPPGACLGLAFPSMLQRASSQDARAGVALCWTFNGVASVLGGALSVVISVQAGLRVTLLCAAVLYGVAAALMHRSRV